ncbi:MAG: hypothetical protein RL595_1849 [Planctomycetota bacterium]
MKVLLVGTLDTKGQEFAFLKDLLLKKGVECLVADAGALGEPSFKPDISKRELFLAGGTTLEKVLLENDRGKAVEAAAKGISQIALRLYQEGKIAGLLGMGGSAGTTIATAAMRALPFGIPKIMVSTLASGQVRPFVGVKDITMIHSVVDISGINRISRVVIANAACAMAGMLQGVQLPEYTQKPVIGATMFGVTTPCVERARKSLEEANLETMVFHATGTGGATMESFIQDGLIQGVLDITTTELADELVGGILSAGKERLTAASIAGIPQVISVGALDMVNFGPKETVPEKFRHRLFHVHNANVTLMRTTPEENDALGKEIAWKASAARGPVVVMFPLKGISALDAPGKPFWCPEANKALQDSLKLWILPEIPVLELDYHINDAAFADACTSQLLRMLARQA